MYTYSIIRVYTHTSVYTVYTLYTLTCIHTDVSVYTLYTYIVIRVSVYRKETSLYVSVYTGYTVYNDICVSVYRKETFLCVSVYTVYTASVYTLTLYTLTHIKTSLSCIHSHIYRYTVYTLYTLKHIITGTAGSTTYPHTYPHKPKPVVAGLFSNGSFKKKSKRLTRKKIQTKT